MNKKRARAKQDWIINGRGQKRRGNGKLRRCELGEAKAAYTLQRTPFPSSLNQLRALKLHLFFKHRRKTSSCLPSKPLAQQFWICSTVKWLVPGKVASLLRRPVLDREVSRIPWSPVDDLHITEVRGWPVTFCGVLAVPFGGRDTLRISCVL